MTEERDGKPAWYVAHTYSGYELRVKKDLEQTIKNRNLEDTIFEVVVPTQIVTEIKGKEGKEKKTEKKLYPGYVLVNMIMTDETWFVVRNTRGVTGFVGPGSKPVPVPIEEIEALKGQEKEVVVDFAIGDLVSVAAGPWKDIIGNITTINKTKRTLTIEVEFMQRSMPLELSFSDVKKVK